MPLPKIATPTYELELPSTGKTIKYRPFLVKEEKILILALESEDVKQITSAIKNTLKDCIITRGIKVEELPAYYASRTLLGEIILPEDIANACFAYVSGLLNKSTGNVLNVDGGIAAAFVR